MLGLGVQTLFISVIYVLMGLGHLKYEAWTASSFVMGVFAETAALVFLVVKYLFRPSSDRFKLIQRLEQRDEKDGKR